MMSKPYCRSSCQGQEPHFQNPVLLGMTAHPQLEPTQSTICKPSVSFPLLLETMSSSARWADWEEETELTPQQQIEERMRIDQMWAAAGRSPIQWEVEVEIPSPSTPPPGELAVGIAANDDAEMADISEVEDDNFVDAEMPDIGEVGDAYFVDAEMSDIGEVSEVDDPAEVAELGILPREYS